MCDPFGMKHSSRDRLYRRHRFPADVIAHAVWLYFRFPLSLRMVEDLLAARCIVVSHQTVRQWAEKFGRSFANIICKRTAGKLLKRQGQCPRVMITDTLRSYGITKRDLLPSAEHRSHKGLNNRVRTLINRPGDGCDC